jgi:prophage regulatory protein
MKFLRIRQVTGLSRMTIYRLELAGQFPKRRQLSKHSVAWLDTDIAQWAESRSCQPVEGYTRPDVWHEWCGLRLTHRSSCGLVRDRRNPALAGCRQGYASITGMRKSRSFKGLPRLRRCNPGSQYFQYVIMSYGCRLETRFTFGLPLLNELRAG